MHIVHLSDIHFWQYEFNPLRLMGKRLHGMASLLAGRAGFVSALAGIPSWSSGSAASSPTTS